MVATHCLPHGAWRWRPVTAAAVLIGSVGRLPVVRFANALSQPIAPRRGGSRFPGRSNSRSPLSRASAMDTVALEGGVGWFLPTDTRVTPAIDSRWHHAHEDRRLAPRSFLISHHCPRPCNQERAHDTPNPRPSTSPGTVQSSLNLPLREHVRSNSGPCPPRSQMSLHAAISGMDGFRRWLS